MSSFEKIFLRVLNQESIRKLAFELVAHRWVAGNNLEDAIERARILNSRGIAAIINHVGEHITSSEQGEKESKEYFRIIDALVANNIRASISLKPSQLITTKNVDDLVKALEPIVKKAQKNDIIVCVDMEDSSCTQMTIDTYKILFCAKGYNNLQIVIQAYLHRTTKDLEELEKIGAKVRICKGAYRTESPDVVIKGEENICKAFAYQLKTILINGKLSLISVATHDQDIIRKVKWLDETDLDLKFEFQMLIGMNDRLMYELAKDGYVISAYVPYGNNWIPYFYRRVRENKDYIAKGIKSLL